MKFWSFDEFICRARVLTNITLTFRITPTKIGQRVTMKKLTTFAAIVGLGVGLASMALAGAQVQLQDSETARQAALRKAYYDHPATQVVPSKDVKVVITKDSIMRSCCMPPNLVVAGDVTNITPHPVSYVRMVISFEDVKGKILHAETIYNMKAASLGEDEDVRRLLNETPHFDPLLPGSSDRFTFSIPTPMLPNFAKVELYPDAIVQ